MDAKKVNALNNNFGGGGYLPLLASFIFNGLSGSIVPSAGGVAPSFTRATTATITDQDLVVRQVLSGEARFGGFRRVRNVLSATEALSGGSWTAAGSGTVTSGFSAPDGTNTAFKIVTSTAAANSGIFQASSTFTTGTNSVWMRGEVGGERAQFGDATNRTAVTLSTQWRRFSGTVAQAGAAFILYSEVVAQTWYVWHPQVEDVTGQSNQNPAEYVSVGVLSAPYQGANVDGVQYFPYLNGNTVASNVVTEARGAAISSSILGGYLPEPAATNLQLWSSDHTNATYTKTDTTPTITGTDPSGTSLANLNTEGVAGTATVQSAAMAITANTSNTFSIYAKRGNTDWVCLQLINGAVTSGVRAWFNLNTGAKGSTTTIGTGSGATSEITPLGNSWYRISLAGVVDAASVTAITFIQTASADASLVRVNNGTYQTWGRQFNTGRQIGLINSYIPTTTVAVTRNADVLTYATTGWLNANAGSLYGEFFNPTLSGPYVIASLNNGGGNDRINIYANTITTAGQDVLIGGATQSSLSAVALTGGAIAKIITMYQVNDFAGYANNTTLGTDAAGNLPTVTALNIGNVVGSNYLGHYIRTVAYWRSRLPNAIAQAKTV